ncbi:MAG: YceI family protein [Leptospiraceae bacterium]|nr:YceI family protein [Leptospiraceae bacterium]
MKILKFFIIFFLASRISITGLDLPTGSWNIESGTILFRSEAPNETIVGKGSKVSGNLDMKKKSVSVTIDLSDWSTGHNLRDKHMHENYLETQKFPLAKFEGYLQNFNPKTAIVALKGKIFLHGVTQEVILEGELKKDSSGDYVFFSEFNILLSDYKIPIPKLLILKLNEKIQVRTKFNLKKKN